MKTKILASLLASAAVGVCSSAVASTITNLDLTNASPFGGFDWAANGTAVSSPGPAYTNGQVITTTFFADAVSIVKTGGGTFSTPNMVTTATGGAFAAGKYEYTVVATITEVITCLNLACTAADFTATGGTYNVYYDNATLSNTIANQIAATGFTDGALLLSGSISPGDAGIFVASGTGGTGIFNFVATNLSTNAAYIQPNQTGTSAVATLQFGTSTTNWTAATALPGGGSVAGAIQFQADGNQAFVVPEPGTLAMLGIGLLGVFGGLRVRERKLG